MKKSRTEKKFLSIFVDIDETLIKPLGFLEDLVICILDKCSPSLVQSTKNPPFAAIKSQGSIKTHNRRLDSPRLDISYKLYYYSNVS